MNDDEIIIIGANGQLGKALKIRYPGARFADSDSLDITDKNAINDYDWSGIKHILNAAAYTNVDGAETSEGRVLAWKINTQGVANLAGIAIKHDLTIVHISSDYVFDGTKENHLEVEAFSPLGVYGQTKAAGDLVVSLVPKHYILRTSWVIGDGDNFVRTMLRLGKQGVEPKVVNDQIGRLTFTSELVKAIDFLNKSNVDYGTYNISNSGDVVSWADITKEIFYLAGYKLQVHGITTNEYFKDKAGIAPRPNKSSLSLDKISRLGFQLTDWREDLGKYIRKELDQ